MRSLLVHYHSAYFAQLAFSHSCRRPQPHWSCARAVVIWYATRKLSTLCTHTYMSCHIIHTVANCQGHLLLHRTLMWRMQQIQPYLMILKLTWLLYWKCLIWTSHPLRTFLEPLTETQLSLQQVLRVRTAEEIRLKIYACRHFSPCSFVLFGAGMHCSLISCVLSDVRQHCSLSSSLSKCILCGGSNCCFVSGFLSTCILVDAVKPCCLSTCLLTCICKHCSLMVCTLIGAYKHYNLSSFLSICFLIDWLT